MPNYTRFWTIFLLLLFWLSAGTLASAQENALHIQRIPLIGTVYSFDGKDSAYELTETTPSQPTDKVQTVGSLFLISNNITHISNENGVPEFEIRPSGAFGLSYQYDDTLAKAAETDFHLCADGTNKVNNIELETDIEHGALILQTSPDGEHWTTLKEITDLSQSVRFGGNRKNDEINKIQLLNGWYYRLWVAFSTEKTEKTGHWWNKMTAGTTYKKYLVAYTFKAGYKKRPDEFSPEKYCYGKDHTKKADDNTYSSFEVLEKDDLQYSWELGQFCLKGYAFRDGDVFQRERKPVKLYFELQQYIDRLNNQPDLSVERDKNGSDRSFETLAHDNKRGELIVKHKDSSGKIHKAAYTDFLAALSYPNTQTTIDFAEEGEYEVHLNYALRKKSFGPFGKTQNYQLAFKFKIENGNCFPYLRDAQTLDPLEGDVMMTPNGFQLSTGGTRATKLEVEKYRLYNEKNRLKTDLVRHWTIGKGEKITDEGLYIITATCPDKKTVKTVCVGNSKELKAYKRNFTIDRLHTLAEINAQLKQKYKIDGEGELHK